jgi:RNA polymerase sigma-70 factor (ECF subfamily)
MPLTDTHSSLLSRIKDLGDVTGWDRFHTLYRPLLVQYARQRGLDAEAAEEVAQQCFVALVDNIGRFKRQRSFRGWLRGMVDHKVKDLLARKHKVRDLREAASAEGNHSPKKHADAWEREWNSTMVDALLARLRTGFADHTLRAFEMYVLEERPVGEISQLLGMTPNQIYVAKSRVSRYIRENCADLIDAFYGIWE